MKKLVLLTLILSIFFMHDITWAKKPICTFTGKINGIKAKPLSCEIAKAGTKPYVLVSVKIGKKRYMMDLSGISKNNGRHKMSLSVMEYKGRKFQSTYSANGTLTIKTPKKYPNVRYINTDVNVVNRHKKKIKISGFFSWVASKLPEEDRKGSLSQIFGGIKCKAASAKLGTWNNGFQVEKLFIVKPGETANTTLFFPSKKPGTYSGKGVSLRIFHFKMANGKMESDIMKSTALKVIVKNSAGKINIEYTGTMKSKKGPIAVRGNYRE